GLAEYPELCDRAAGILQELKLSLERSLDSYAKVRRTICHSNPGAAQGGDLLLGRTGAAADDRARVAHALAGRRRLACDEGGDRLGHVRFDELRSPIFCVAADFAHYQDGFCLRIGLKHLEQVDEGRADDRIAADPHACRLAEPQTRKLPDGFIGQRAAAADDSDRASLVDVPGHDADLALAGRDDAGTV